MADIIRASDQISITKISDGTNGTNGTDGKNVDSTTRYYLIQPSNSPKPEKPTDIEPSRGWDDTEPGYQGGVANSLYFVDLTTFSDGSYIYSEVSLSSTYEAAKDAWKKAQTTQDNLDNLQVGGTNLIPNSEYETTCDYTHYIYTADILAPHVGKDIVFSIDMRSDSPDKEIWIYGYQSNGISIENTQGTAFKVHPPTDKFERYHFKTKAYDYGIRNPAWTDGKIILIDWTYDSQNPSNFYVRNPKIELGHIPSAWSPAPDDVTVRLIDAETEITRNSKEIKMQATEINEINGKIVEQNTSITQNANSIELTATKIDNLQIGGTNLVLDSARIIKSKEYRLTTYKTAYPLKEGQLITVSLCVTPSEDVSYLCPYLSQGYQEVGRLYPSGTSKQILTMTKEVHYYEGRAPEDNILNADIRLYRFPNNELSNGETTIHWIKIETGNKATDWSPAPQDISAIETFVGPEAPPNPPIGKVWLDTSVSPAVFKEYTNAEEDISTNGWRVLTDDIKIQNALGALTEQQKNTQQSLEKIQKRVVLDTNALHIYGSETESNEVFITEQDVNIRVNGRIYSKFLPEAIELGEDDTTMRMWTPASGGLAFSPIKGGK